MSWLKLLINRYCCI